VASVFSLRHPHASISLSSSLDAVPPPAPEMTEDGKLTTTQTTTTVVSDGVTEATTVKKVVTIDNGKHKETYSSNEKPIVTHAPMSRGSLGLFSQSDRSFSKVDKSAVARAAAAGSSGGGGGGSSSSSSSSTGGGGTAGDDTPPVIDEASQAAKDYVIGTQWRMRFGDGYYPIVQILRPGPNAAVGKTATVDSEEAGYEAVKALDERRATYWCSKAGVEKAVWTVDLSSKVTIYAMRIKWKFHAAKFAVTVSNDKQTFFDVFTEEKGTSEREIPIATFTARYVRITMEQPAKKVNGESVSILAVEI
jgi:hypothetical protein